MSGTKLFKNYCSVLLSECQIDMSLFLLFFVIVMMAALLNSLLCSSVKESISIAIAWPADGAARSPGNCPAKGTGSRHTVFL